MSELGEEMGTQNQTRHYKFSIFSCFLLSLLVAGLSFLIYFFVPEETEPKKTMEPVDLALVIQDEPEEETFDDIDQFNYDDFLTEVSFEAFNKSSDKGLILYRQSMSKAAVERFYTSITGNKEITRAILLEAEKNSIPLSLAFALAYTESRYKVRAVNHNTNGTIDRGLFQLNSSSFPSLTEEDFFDPYVSAKYGMSHLKHDLKMAGNNEVSALAMYNAGAGSVRSNRTPQTTLNYIGKIISYQKKLDDMFYEDVVSFYETQIVPGITPAFTEKSSDF